MELAMVAPRWLSMKLPTAWMHQKITITTEPIVMPSRNSLAAAPANPRPESSASATCTETMG